MTADPDTKHVDSPRPHWRSILTDLGIQPSKALGQNFLHDTAIVRRIVDAADVGRGDLVVEVGPGLGVMTRELASRAAEIVAIEIDRRLANYLRSLELPGTTVVESDVLTIDLREITGNRPYIVVANLPYSVAAAAIAHILEGAWRPERLVVMVQREVAERIAARPPEMSILSVAVQYFGQPKILFRIGPGAFVPAPKVESAVVKIEVAEDTPLEPAERELFFRLVRAGFGQRRKQLMNSIAAGLQLEKPVVKEALSAAGIDPRRRPQTLDLDDWLRLFTKLPRNAFDD